MFSYLLLFFHILGSDFLIESLEEVGGKGFEAVLHLRCKTKEEITKWKNDYENLSRRTFSFQSGSASGYNTYVSLNFLFIRVFP